MASGASNKLATTTFETAPDNALEVVDVYTSESSGVENSFQDAYHSLSDNFDSLAGQAKSALATVNGLAGQAKGAVSGVTGKVNSALGVVGSIKAGVSKFNSVLGGLKRGDLSSLVALTGGTSNGLKQIADVARSVTSGVNQVKSAVNAVSTVAANLKGGINIKGVLGAVESNLPIAKQIRSTIRDVGGIANSVSSLEGSINRASQLLGGDRSSLNTVLSGTLKKSGLMETLGKFDRAITTAQTSNVLNKFSNISSTIGNAIGQLPDAAQTALVRGLSNEAVDRGLILGSGDDLYRTQSEVASVVINPLNKIVDSFTGNTTITNVVQDTGALAGLVSGVTNLASKAGLRDTFSKMTQNITDSGVLQLAAKPLAMRAIEEGDLDMLMDLSKSGAATALTSLAPDIISSTCANVLRPEGLGQQGFAGLYDDVKTAFNAIDPQWSTYATPSGNAMVNGAAIASNPFMCDIIEASLNQAEHNGVVVQNVSSPNVTGTQLVPMTLEPEMDVFSAQLADNLARYQIENAQVDDEADVPVIAMARAMEIGAMIISGTPKSFEQEPYMLLGSVYLDNTIDSEIENHFPGLFERFKLMDTFAR